MSFSTRSSLDLNGSLSRTVRWAWSLSLRCTQSTVKSRRRSLARRMNSPRSRARVVCGGVDHGLVDVGVVADPVEQVVALHPVVEPPLAVDVVVLQVEQGHLGWLRRQLVAVAVLLDQAVLDHPVAFAVKRQRIVLEALQAVLPHVERLVLLGRQTLSVPELEGPVEVLATGCRGRSPPGRWPGAPVGGR